MKSTKDLLAFHMLNGYNDEILKKMNYLKEKDIGKINLNTISENIKEIINNIEKKNKLEKKKEVFITP